MQHIKASFDKHYPAKIIQKQVKISKSRTPIKDARCISARNKTPVRPRMGMQRKVIKDNEIKTERSFLKEKIDTKDANGQNNIKWKTQREENQEPEPPISEDYDEPVTSSTFVINSNDLYGVYSDED